MSVNGGEDPIGARRVLLVKQAAGQPRVTMRCSISATAIRRWRPCAASGPGCSTCRSPPASISRGFLVTD
jgi:hypothetical protein